MEDDERVATATGARLGIEALFAEQAGRMWRSLLLTTGDPEVARDAVAEAFAQALGRGDALRDPAAWVWRTAFRIADRETSARQALEVLPDELPGVEDASLVELFSSLGVLTKHQRTALVLADYAGYPHRTIARILGSSTSAIGVHVYRARRRMRTLLEVEND